MASLKPPFYIVSDTHWYHKNIVRYQNRPYDHEVMMTKRWSRIVRDSDTIVHLGDLFFGGQAGYDRFLNEVTPRLTGTKYLILGNHDKKKWDYEALGFTVIKPFTCWYRNYQVSFDHYPKLIDPNDRKRIHVHGHVHTNDYAFDEPTRFANINVSVEVMDYRPHRITRLLNAEIRKRNQKGKGYYNSKGFRWNQTQRQRRAA
jgi:calcineurin-like phosphoesterase family protein